MNATLLHLGIAWSDLPDAWRRLCSRAPTLLHDRWDAWGEPFDSVPRTPFAHIVIAGESGAYDSIVAEMADLLARDPAGTWIAVETTASDWSVTDAGGRIWHRLEGPSGPVVVIEVHPAPM